MALNKAKSEKFSWGFATNPIEGGVLSGQFCPNREAAKQAAKCCS